MSLHCERPRLHFEPLKLLNFDFSADGSPAFIYISQFLTQETLTECFSPKSGAGAGGGGDQQHNFSAQPPPPPPPNSSFTAAAAAQGGPTGTVGGPPGTYFPVLFFYLLFFCSLVFGCSLSCLSLFFLSFSILSVPSYLYSFFYSVPSLLLFLSFVGLK